MLSFSIPKGHGMAEDMGESGCVVLDSNKMTLSVLQSSRVFLKSYLEVIIPLFTPC